jgi:hypothetical protein
MRQRKRHTQFGTQNMIHRIIHTQFDTHNFKQKFEHLNLEPRTK